MGASITIEVPFELSGTENDLRRFFDAMVYKLKKNAHKGKWEALELSEAINRLRDEVDELEEAANVSHNTIEIVLEAADVANFAMMICSIAVDGQKPEKADD